jgi:hypothetical protein
LIRRLERRNTRSDTPTITPAMLEWMASVSQDPQGEGETVAPQPVR